MTSKPGELVRISRKLCAEVSGFTFSLPVTHVYNPLQYARRPHEAYLDRYGSGQKKVVLVGMNPGPFGMAQTGVPFGDIKCTRDFLKIAGEVERPEIEHPARPVEGFGCRRSEVSGTRLWGWVQARFETPERFFKDYWVANYCPLVFMSTTGSNITPDKLSRAEQSRLFAACDEALLLTCRAVGARCLVGIGGFAAARCQAVAAGEDLSTAQILHPSPASPVANRGWAQQVEKQLEALKILF